MTKNPDIKLARSNGSATIAFGLVSCPVKIYPAHAEEERISFHLHHDADNGRLKQQHICTTCSEVVDGEHTVKGFEHAKGQSVMFTAAELVALDDVSTNAIAIDRFVPTEAIDTRFYDKTYYLGPDKGSDRAYRLIADALVETRRVAVATFSRKGKEKLVIVRAFFGDGDIANYLVLHELHFAHEVRPIDAVPAVDLDSHPTELRLAKQIIMKSSVDDIDVDAYSDRVRTRIIELIEAKVDGGQIVVTPVAAPSGVTDMVEALRASLDIAPKRSSKVAPKRSRGARVQAVSAKRASSSSKKGRTASARR